MTVGLPAVEHRPGLFLGDEAVALGALHAGISAAYAYPGTPSTEIFEFLSAAARHDSKVAAHWCANEKTALEQALGVSMMNRRVLVSMKHVGLNVAMDPFVNAALVGIRGGLVLAVADDPGMHSSQNEQDSRILADFARIPILEPADQQEAYDMTREAFELSERFQVPVLVRLVTRLCHSRAALETAAPAQQRPAGKASDPSDWILLPANARRLWRNHLEKQEDLLAWSEASGHNRVEHGGGEELVPLGVVTTGIARGYLLENLSDLTDPYLHLHVGAYPLPVERIRSFAGRVERILVLEEGYPHLERLLRGILPTTAEVRGRMSGHLPADGELTPDTVRLGLGLEPRPAQSYGGPGIPARPPQLCQGCPHRDSYGAVLEAIQDFETPVVTGDIGCYTLGALSPFRAIESCVCMGASIGMAKGVSDAGVRPVLAVIGDSTFLHSGVTALMDAAARDTDMTVLILDNETVGMTGQQDTVLPDSRILPIVLALGVDPAHVHQAEAHPRKTQEMAALLRREMDHPGLSVIVGVRECIVAARKRKAEMKRAVDQLVGAGTAKEKER